VRPERLQELIRGFPECRVAVLGDYFLDKYLEVDPRLAEVSLETGKTAHQVVSIRCSPGAAGTVVNNLAALGAGRLYCLGFTGNDGEGFELRRALQNIGCDTRGLITLQDRFTPTYLKPRTLDNSDLTGEHERYDTKNRRPVPPKAQESVLAHLEGIMRELDAVIVVDQVEEGDCGVVGPRVRGALADLAGRFAQKRFWVDSRSRIGLFRNVMIKVNVHEAIRQIRPDGARPARGGAEREVELVRQAISELRERTGKPVFVTAGKRGIWVADPEPELVRAVLVPDPVDPTGAGDSATAAAVLGLCAGASLREAALLANLAASITVQLLACTGTARPDQLVPRLEIWRSQG